MQNFSGILRASENKVIILCSVKLLTETACLLHNASAHDKEMTDIVIGTQQIQVKVRFQMWLEMLVQFCGNFVLIRVKCVCLRMILSRSS